MLRLRMIVQYIHPSLQYMHSQQFEERMVVSSEISKMLESLCYLHASEAANARTK